MTIAISRSRPSLPREKSVYTRRPLYGRTAASIVDMGNHLAGWRFRRCYAKIWDWPVAGSGLSAIPASLTLRYRHRASPDAEFLFVAFQYDADEDTADASVVLAATAINSGATDAGCTFSAAAGTLSHRGEDASSAVPNVAHTGFTTQPGVATLTDYPRPLSVESWTAAQRDLEVTFTCAYVRVHSATIFELYSELV